MSNTQRLGFNYRGKAWDDGNPITVVPMADGTLAEGIASLFYLYDPTVPGFVKAHGDGATGAIFVEDALTSTRTSHLPITASAGGNTTVLNSGANGYRVHSLFLMASGTVNVKWNGTTAGDVTGLGYLIANTGMVLPHNPEGWFEVGVGDTLRINLSTGVAVGGVLNYGLT